MQTPFTDRILDIGYRLLDKGIIPDVVTRTAIRALCRQRLREIDMGSLEANHAAKLKWIEGVRSLESIAILTDKANEQHYEVPTEFIVSCLGPYAKYSCCLYPTGHESLEEAEVLMLESYCQKASLRDGQDILDLGCGWGSLSLYMAEKYPKSRIVGLSNSTTQKEYIERSAKGRGLPNLEIITADVNQFDFNGTRHFDRILSIEMFEHMKNYKMLMSKIATWLRPKHIEPASNVASDDALFFVHIFCHRDTPYHFEEGDGWMSKTFFSGGTMPSHDLLLYFQDDLTLIRSWYINGRHYSQTCNDWLKLQDAHKAQGLSALEKEFESRGLTKEEGRVLFNRFRVFYMACAELFGLRGGEEWGVGHYLFKRKD